MIADPIVSPRVHSSAAGGKVLLTDEIELIMSSRDRAVIRLDGVGKSTAIQFLWPHANLLFANLDKAKLASADFDHAVLSNASLVRCDLSRADLRACDFHYGSTRCGLVDSPYPSHGTRTGFYTDDYNDRHYRKAEEIRKANMRGRDLRGAKIDGTDFYLVDLRDAKLDNSQRKQLAGSGAILA